MSDVLAVPIEQDGLPGTLEPTRYALPDDISYAQWEEVGEKLGVQAEVQACRMDMLRWWIGDWLLYGEHTYGEKYSQAVQILGHRWAVGTLQGWMWMAGAYQDFPRGKYQALTWGHYKQVAALTPRQRTPLLQQALDNGWSTAELREAKKRKYPPEVQIQPVQPPPPSPAIERGVAYAAGCIGRIWEPADQAQLAAFLLVPGPDDGAQDDQ